MSTIQRAFDLLKLPCEHKSRLQKILVNSASYDVEISRSLERNIDNIFLLEETDFDFIIGSLEKIGSTNKYSPVYFIENLPSLLYHNIENRILDTSVKLKDYNSRTIGYLFGTENFNPSCVSKVLQCVPLDYYISLLNMVDRRHEELGAIGAFVIVHCESAYRYFEIDEVADYLNLVCELLEFGGLESAEAFVINLEAILAVASLGDIGRFISDVCDSEPYIFSIACKHPNLFAITKFKRTESAVSNDNAVQFLTDFDKDPASVVGVLSGSYSKYVYNLVANWDTFSPLDRINILFQLKRSLDGKEVCKSPTFLHGADDRLVSGWNSRWTYCSTRIDIEQVRRVLGAIFQNFSAELKRTVVKQNRSVFDRRNPDYDASRIRDLANAVGERCNGDLAEYCEAAACFANSNRVHLRDHLSKDSLYFETWDRNPWTDYGLADEFYSCTGIGDYAAGQAPRYLDDPSISNLDVWNNKNRVGRVRLAIVKDDLGSLHLLVDSLDGSDRVIQTRKRLAEICDALVDFAEWIGLDRVLVNCSITFNRTPKSFVQKLRETLRLSENELSLQRLCSTAEFSNLPHPGPVFLEAFALRSRADVRVLDLTKQALNREG